jgi:hypothetical protein
VALLEYVGDGDEHGGVLGQLGGRDAGGGGDLGD